MKSGEMPSVHDVPISAAGIWNALGLIFLAPLVAEFLLGNFAGHSRKGGMLFRSIRRWGVGRML